MLRDRLLFGRRAGRFTLQWHLTHACELSCRHCYDRSPRSPLTLFEARRVLAELETFCDAKRVKGQLSLSGGNPLLHPDFDAIWQAASDAGFPASILGNPSPRDRLERLLAIARPTYYQVSLEGLREHDDHIRGEGHFDSTFAFLEVLAALGVRAHVMLTLTRANLSQVIPLGEALRGRVHRFTFNRLSQVGSGRDLELPTRDEYVAFLRRYLVASRTNPVLGFKDGLFNIARRHFRRPLHGGCTGHGCGAAFNFVALLPDGEVHACRKLPSLLGNIHDASLGAIYDSALARRFRTGNASCRSCGLRTSCGGCPAVIHGSGKRALVDPDPHCFMADREIALAGPWT
jgi:selenobiotic family peptide radical SAM maturase